MSDPRSQRWTKNILTQRTPSTQRYFIFLSFFFIFLCDLCVRKDFLIFFVGPVIPAHLPAQKTQFLKKSLSALDFKQNVCNL